MQRSLSVISAGLVALLAPAAAFAQNGKKLAGERVMAKDANSANMQARFNQLRPVAGGMTGPTIGKLARSNSPNVAAKSLALKAAAAKLDQATAQYFPRLNLTGRYTRLSDTSNNSSAGPAFNVVTPAAPTPTGPLPPGFPLAAVPFSFGSFNVPLNQWNFTAQLVVPVSDYFLRISKNHAAASHNRDAARWDHRASAAQASTNAQVAFYQWVKSRGQYAAVGLALETSREHLKDVELMFKVGNASKADLLLAQGQVQNGELTLKQAEQMVAASEAQVRSMTHFPANRSLQLGEDVTKPVIVGKLDLKALKQEALQNRAELRSLQASALGLTKTEALAGAAMWPSLSLVGNVIHANPNQRFIPLQQEFRTTWDVSAQLSWSPNDVLAGKGSKAETRARTAQLRAQTIQARDGILLEVTQAVLQAQTAKIAAKNTLVQMRTAEEAYRVRRELFRAGQSTSTEMSNTESQLFRSRLAAVSAHIDVIIAKIKLEHAVGRDVSAPARRRPASATRGG